MVKFYNILFINVYQSSNHILLKYKCYQSKYEGKSL